MSNLEWREKQKKRLKARSDLKFLADLRLRRAMIGKISVVELDALLQLATEYVKEVANEK